MAECDRGRAKRQYTVRWSALLSEILSHLVGGIERWRDSTSAVGWLNSALETLFVFGGVSVGIDDHLGAVEQVNELHDL
jgi:hypothetical protein